MPLAAAASTVASESTATVTRAPQSAMARRRCGSTVSLASSRSWPSPARAMPTTSRGGRRAEAAVPGLGQPAGQGGALEGLHVGAQAVTGQGRRHGGHVVLEGDLVDHQGRGLQVGGQTLILDMCSAG